MGDALAGGELLVREHYVVEPLTPLWWFGIVFSVVLIAGLVWAVRATGEDGRNRLFYWMGVYVFVHFAVTQLFLIFIDQSWTVVDSLPLHLCRLSFLFVGILFLTRNQNAYDWCAYLAFPSGIHSILTPEFTQGMNPFMVYDFYFTHGILLAAPVMLSVAGMRPYRWSAARVFLAINVILIFVFAFNLWSGANYLYVNQKPMVDNPFLIGPWPWYILGVELAAILHMAIMDILFRIRPWQRWSAGRLSSQTNLGGK
ncbi:MAG: TIGR02206 family membrane protein [Pseudomonadota bacterium]